MDKKEIEALVEELAPVVHTAWMDSKLALGITSRPADDGEEQMVGWEKLSERARDLDRATVRSVVEALDKKGLRVVAEN